MAQEISHQHVLFLACLCLGLGIGLALGNASVGVLVGMGIGFAAVAFAKIQSVAKLPPSTTAYFISLFGLFLVAAGIGIIFFPKVFFLYILGVFVALFGIGLIIFAIGAISKKKRPT